MAPNGRNAMQALPKPGAGAMRPRVLLAAPLFAAVSAHSPIRTLTECTAPAEAGAEDVSFGSSGTGSVGHVGGVMGSLAAEVTLLRVPYRGASEATTSVLAGTTTSFWNTLGVHAGTVQAG
jgi:tripartite-type tricarboxylate transporter receptor subunit TctC